MISWELHLAGCGSLKEKRMILRSLKDRLRGRRNISIAETDHQDIWQRAQLVAATVATDRRQAESLLSRLDSLIASDGHVRIIDTATVFY